MKGDLTDHPKNSGKIENQVFSIDKLKELRKTLIKDVVTGKIKVAR
ncbi:MAG: hypothetical protein JJV92_06310 [Desulfosarcina sp.]|nr:hypothetical protein [Desulfobacterales bacterium]